MQRKQFIFTGLMVSLLSITGVTNAMNIVGTYQCTGNDPTVTPSAFTQKMIITKQGNAYPMIEANSGSITAYKQFGVLTGNTLSIAYQSTTDAKDFGVQVYVVSHNGKQLKGPFVYYNNFDKEGMETCDKISDSISLK